MSERKVSFTQDGWNEYHYWLNQDKKTLKKINKLVDETCRVPFSGSGKPEPLKENYSGYWSRRIDKQNRLIYSVSDTDITVVACRFHY
ncbi:MAG: Txe/YoeB family addiction module toxin [Acidimicrobiales bacterium]|nr:Txe/YoeB family addiction module toxin [Acidimicrobiales bacterium]